MSRFIYLFFICLYALPLTGYSADESQETYLIAKDKLKCLYQQTDNLLKEPEPVPVLLNSRCAQPQAQLHSGEKSLSPIFNPRINVDAPTLKSEDFLMLRHTQLKCFKQIFEELMKQASESVTVRFTDTCNIDSDDNS